MKNLVIALKMILSGEEITIAPIEESKYVALNGHGYENIIITKVAYESLKKAVSEHNEITEYDENSGDELRNIQDSPDDDIE